MLVQIVLSRNVQQSVKNTDLLCRKPDSCPEETVGDVIMDKKLEETSI